MVSKKFLKKQRYKRLMSRDKGKDKNAAKTLLKKDLRKDSDLKQRFKRANKEAAHLRAGGQSRISHLKESVEEKDSKLVDLVADMGLLLVVESLHTAYRRSKEDKG